MLTDKELTDLRKQLWDAKMQTDDRLERSAIDAAIAALWKMAERAKKLAAA